MTWVRLDDGISTHRKTSRVGLEGLGLLSCLLCYCARHLTDGMVPKDDLRVVWPWDAEAAKAAVDQLVRAGFLDDIGHAWSIHDYLEYQPSRAKVEHTRKVNAVRQRRHRNGVTDALLTPPVTHESHGGDAGDSRERSNGDSRARSPKSRHGTPSRPVPSRPVPRESTASGAEALSLPLADSGAIQAALASHDATAAAATPQLATKLLKLSRKNGKTTAQVVEDIEAVASKADAAILSGQPFDTIERLVTFVRQKPRESATAHAPAPYHAVDTSEALPSKPPLTRKASQAAATAAAIASREATS